MFSSQSFCLCSLFAPSLALSLRLGPRYLAHTHSLLSSSEPNRAAYLSPPFCAGRFAPSTAHFVAQGNVNNQFFPTNTALHSFLKKVVLGGNIFVCNNIEEQEGGTTERKPHTRSGSPDASSEEDTGVHPSSTYTSPTNHLQQTC